VADIAKGTFQVVIKPQGPSATQDANTLGRMLLDNAFEGDLKGVGQGEMLTALTQTKGSAGYVAIEQQFSITVVPDSGTGELLGIAGTFKLNILDGKHFYEFEYSLPATPPG